jgi:hypothetical protein
MKNEYHKTVMIFLATLVVAMVCVLFSGCEKATTDVPPGDCGDSLTWVYESPLQYTDLIVDILPMNEGQWNPNTTFAWSEQGTYKTAPYDGGGPYAECYLYHKYVAWAMIDPQVPGTVGEFVFYEEGLIRTVNILDGVSWN